MDFSLLESYETFKLEDYFQPIIKEFKALGKEVLINKKEKSKQTNVESAFLKADTAMYDLRFKTDRQIKIKIEVDINPPPEFSTEHKFLLLPFSFMCRCFILPDLFAGKMHALLFRNWKNRVKGRDWYDFEWYVRNNIVLDFNHLLKRTLQFGSLLSGELTKDNFKHLLKEKIKQTNIELVKADVRPFLKHPEEMGIWSIDYFIQLADMIQIA